MLIQKTVTARHENGRAPICGFVAYVSAERNILLRRRGWETGDDVHDGFYDELSTDNGESWSPPRPSLGSRPVEGGYEYFIEFAALLHGASRQFVVLTNGVRQSSLDHHEPGNPSHLRITRQAEDSFTPSGAADEAGGGLTAEALVPAPEIPAGQYPQVSFCNPIEDSRGRILVPVQWQKRDCGGSLRRLGIPMHPDMPDIALDYGESRLMIGDVAADGAISWRFGGAVPLEAGRSTRGLYEGTVTELTSGRLAMVLRGSNGRGVAGGPRRPELPGYKWLSLSADGGESWSPAEPLQCDDGSLLESGSSGSALIRSNRSGRLYWLGNLCLEGERANGNFPRAPLVLADVQEEPFRLKRSSMRVVDQRSAKEDESVQLSNFKHYLDRETGDLVLYLTRYGERGSAGGSWLLADQYEYRVRLD